MSNLLLRQLRAQGIIAGEMLPFARSSAARDFATRTQRIVMVVPTVNTGDYWVVSAEDAERLQAAGFKREQDS